MTLLFLPLLSCHSFLGTGSEQERNSDLAIMYHKYGMIIFFSPRVSAQEI
jgi:hypothetical protein